MAATYKQICEHVFSGEPSRDDLINQLTEYRIKHEVACSTLELVKERIAAAHRALAAQSKHTKELEHQLDELRKQNKSLKESLIKWRQREWPNTDQRAVVEREFPVIAK